MCLSVCVPICLFVEIGHLGRMCVGFAIVMQRPDPFAAVNSPGPRCLVIPLCLL